MIRRALMVWALRFVTRRAQRRLESVQAKQAEVDARLAAMDRPVDPTYYWDDDNDDIARMG